MDACLLLERCKQGVVCFDPSGTITYANLTACGIFKRSGSEVCGKCIEDLLQSVFSEGAYKTGSRLHLDLLLQEGGEQTNGKAYVAHPDGTGTPIEYRLASAELREGGSGYVMTCQDVSERVETEARLAHLAHHDPLTDLPNRRLLSERLDYEMARARRYGDTFALHLIDLDDFKSVNDRYGHPVGDQLLMRLADRMKATVRGSDTIARIGGDEFAIIQVAVGERDDVAALARKLLAECQRPVHLNGYELFPAVTIGVSFFAGDQSEEGLWLQADAALYKAKMQGKNTFVVVDEVITQSIKCNAQMVFALEHAVDYQQFHLVYQPQFGVNSGALIGVEALLRWQHPELGDVGPATFIPLAEQHGFIHEIGLWVVREVCRQIRCWLDAAIPFGRVAINVSPLQLSNKNHIDTLVATIEGAGIPWATLELEITETAYFAASRDVLQILGSLQHRGARIAIDDFGTGYSSLLALLRMKADTLKIDKAFIDELHNAEAAGIVKETIALAHVLGMAALAEGVETPSQLALLEAFGCDRSQGFYLGLPSEVAELENRFFAISGTSSVRHGHAVSAHGEQCEPDLIQWSAGFETGIVQIDLQHQKLVEMINRIAREARRAGGGTSPDMVKVLDEIAHYVTYHFRCEEAFMERLHVADHHTSAHRDNHLSGVEKMQSWISLFHAGRLQLEDLCSNLTQWLSYHMLAEDKMLGEQLVAINRGTTPAEAYRQSMITAALECR
ncbi:MAG: EAL domain-containing protein [Rhodocyclaceae bacterium]